MPRCSLRPPIPKDRSKTRLKILTTQISAKRKNEEKRTAAEALILERNSTRRHRSVDRRQRKQNTHRLFDGERQKRRRVVYRFFEEIRLSSPEPPRREEI